MDSNSFSNYRSVLSDTSSRASAGSGLSNLTQGPGASALLGSLALFSALSRGCKTAARPLIRIFSESRPGTEGAISPHRSFPSGRKSSPNPQRTLSFSLRNQGRLPWPKPWMRATRDHGWLRPSCIHCPWAQRGQLP